MSRATLNMILRIATAIVKRSTELKRTNAARQLNIHLDAKVFSNQLLISDEEGRQYILTITALRKPRIALETKSNG